MTGALIAAYLSCWPVLSLAESALSLDERVAHYSDLYVSQKGDMAVALPNQRSLARLDGSLGSLVFVDAHLIATSGVLRYEGLETLPSHEVQQTLIGTSAYVNTTLSDIGGNSVQIIEQEFKAPKHFEDIPVGIGAGLINEAKQVFQTDCLVMNLLLLGERSQRIASVAEAFLDGGSAPDCNLIEDT